MRVVSQADRARRQPTVDDPKAVGGLQCGTQLDEDVFDEGRGIAQACGEGLAVVGLVGEDEPAISVTFDVGRRCKARIPEASENPVGRPTPPKVRITAAEQAAKGQPTAVLKPFLLVCEWMLKSDRLAGFDWAHVGECLRLHL